jgi:polyisoprenoid-binding protein YceI
MKKTLLILLCVVALGVVVFAVSSRTKSTAPIVVPSDEVAEPIKSDIESATTGDTSSTTTYDATVSFIGYGPGKQHTGTIGGVNSTVAKSATGTFSGSIDVTMSNLSTDTEKVTEHLKTADFFDVAKYPTAKFVFTSNTDTTATGNLTVHGVTKSVTVPFTETATGYESTFTIDMSEFGIEQTFANEEVTVTIKLAQ